MHNRLHLLHRASKHGRGAIMSDPRIPTIFSDQRRHRRMARALARQKSAAAARFILDDITEDVLERLAFVRLNPARAALVGDVTGALGTILKEQGSELLNDPFADIERPWPETGFDFVCVLGLLDAINDLPGALIHIRNALAPGGLVIASFLGGASLPRLRSAMIAADGDRPSPRIHPMVDARAAPQLLQRAGWKDPVVDTHSLIARYSSLVQLVADLRDQGLGNTLANAAPPFDKARLKRARASFQQQADTDGKVSETFEIITLTGRRSLAGT
jgi:SAM-dependent methyltransferase